MGQYYKLVNIDRQEFVHPHEVGNGLKLGELSGWPYSVEAAAKLLTGPKDPAHPLIGSWARESVFVVGDEGSAYCMGPNGLDMNGEVPSGITDDTAKIYEMAQDHDPAAGQDWRKFRFRNISPKVREMMTAVFGCTYHGEGWQEIHHPDGGLRAKPNLAPDYIFTPTARKP